MVNVGHSSAELWQISGCCEGLTVDSGEKPQNEVVEEWGVLFPDLVLCQTVYISFRKFP